MSRKQSRHIRLLSYQYIKLKVKI